MEKLAKRFANAVQEYEALRKKTAVEVIRWEWAAGPYYELLPFEHLRTRFKGKLLKIEPTKKNGCWQYGFDQQNRIVVIRQYTELENSFYEEFFDYSGEVTEGVRFTYADTKELLNVTKYQFEKGLLLYFERHAQMGITKEDYIYQAGKLAKIYVKQQENGQAETTYEIAFKYDELGVIELIENIYPNGYRKNIYQAVPKKRTLQTLLLLIQEMLCQQIPQKITTANIVEKVYCVVLVYDEQNILPPLLGVGLETERQNWLNKNAQKAKSYLWNPAEFSLFDTEKFWLQDQALEKACELANQEIEIQGKQAAAIKMLNQVAKDLAVIDWRGKLNITDDFVVYAVDTHNADFTKNSKVSFPQHLLTAFNQKGWV